jgi:hypothetical protein
MKRRAVYQLMVGLPATGKTTFLAALWHVLRSDEVSGALRLDEVHGNREYLNRIAEQWGRCEPLSRTSMGHHETVAIRVLDPQTGERAELRIPDMLGESFEEQWGARECSLEYAELARDASGVLLFLHPDRTTETDSIAAANEALEGWAGEEARAVPTDGEPACPWEARKAPPQVKMVELLQFLAIRAPGPLRVAVIISAWDQVTEKVGPADWLAQRTPLLYQYLEANADTITWRTYGVSAQGGPQEEAETLLEEPIASHRVKIVGSGVVAHDITAPVKWLMAGDGAPRSDAAG